MYSADCRRGLSSAESCREPGGGSANIGVYVICPFQERIAKSHGSQCGFCTPGIVMSMYTLLRNQPEPTVEEIEDAFQGMGLVQGPGGKGASGFLRRAGQGRSRSQE